LSAGCVSHEEKSPHSPCSQHYCHDPESVCHPSSAGQRGKKPTAERNSRTQEREETGRGEQPRRAEIEILEKRKCK